MILDTCALLWLASGSKKLSRSTLKQINEAPAVYVSAISGFEISLKASQGKLEFSHPVEDWLKRVVEHHGLTILPLDLAFEKTQCFSLYHLKDSALSQFRQHYSN